MKKSYKLFWVCLAIGLVIALAGCASAPVGVTSVGLADELSNSLVGKWTWNTSTLEFFEDGTGVYNDEEFSWEITKNYLYFNYPMGPRLPTVRWSYEISTESLILFDVVGNIWPYQKSNN